jgi:hypothetical protein
MFENLFTPSPMIWGGLIAGLIALPILIHLINMMRHRRVKWAAMDFLLKSYKKNRNWVWLKQLLLLLSRITALLLALFMLAQIGCSNQELSMLLGSKVTHHYVLIDDSYSMQDRVGDADVFERARSTLALIAARAKDRGQQRFTVVRFSKAARVEGDLEDVQDSGNAIIDMNGVVVDSSFDKNLEDLRSKLTISELAVGPKPSLELVNQLINSQKSEEARVYVLSDFRAKDWQDSTEITDQLNELKSNGAEIELIRCADESRGNLAIVELEPVGNVRSVNTPLEMQVSVKNFGTQKVDKVQIKVQSLAYPSAVNMEADAAEMPVDTVDLPTVFIESIAAGETESRKFPVAFADPGKHVIAVKLEDKSVAADNQAFSVCHINPNSHVLLIDGHPDRIYSYYLTINLNPAGERTGIQPESRSKTFLRDATAEALDHFDVIMMTDVDRLDEPSLKNVQQFVERGGGLAIFMGPHVDYDYYSEVLYNSGKGLLPIPLVRKMEIPELAEQETPDIVPSNHPITQTFLNLSSSPLDLVRIYAIARTPELWVPADDRNSEIAATIRGNNRWPLIATKSFGNGRVCVVTTSIGAPWNNWIANGSFPIFPLRIENWAAEGRYPSIRRLAGDSLTIERDTNEYQLSTQLVSPGSEMTSRVVTPLQPQMQDDRRWQAQFKNQSTNEGIGVTERIGIYEIWLKTNEGQVELDRLALNADTAESDLSVASRQTLVRQFEEAQPAVMEWTSFNPEVGRNQTTMLSKIFLIVLIILLLGEQALAYLLSYHPRKTVQTGSLEIAR